MFTRALVSIARGAAAALLLVGCLPGDTRSPPSVIHFTVEPSAATNAGVTTVDGWTIAFERLLVGLGDAGIGDGSDAGRHSTNCDSYANGSYERLFDLTVPGRQKVSDVYGLGKCEIRFSLRTPGTDALLGKGVTAADLDFMRTAETDPFVVKGRRVIYVKGHATRAAVTKHFEWSFRISFNLHDCPDRAGTGATSEVPLIDYAVLPLGIVVHGETLFREQLSDASALRFDAMAAADTDGDQAITLEELDRVAAPLPDLDAGVSGAGGGLAGPDGASPSMARVLYEGLAPRMARLGDSGACLADERNRPRDGG